MYRCVLGVSVCVLGVFEGFDGEIDLTRFMLILISGKDAKHAKEELNYVI